MPVAIARGLSFPVEADGLIGRARRTGRDDIGQEQLKAKEPCEPQCERRRQARVLCMPDGGSGVETTGRDGRRSDGGVAGFGGSEFGIRVHGDSLALDGGDIERQ